MACSDWKKSGIVAKVNEEWNLVVQKNALSSKDTLTDDNIIYRETIKYCPFCSYPLDKDGCTNSNIPYQEIIEFLNEKADRQYRHTTEKYRRKIRSRWQEGMKLQDFKDVVKIKVAEWKGNPKMEEYLRPQTLFGTKMDWYLQAEVPEEKEDKIASSDRSDVADFMQKLGD